MTSQSDFKARVRARMARTGERYAAARAVLLAQARAGADDAGSTVATAAPDRTPRIPLLPGIDAVGGQHTESAALATLLRQAGVVVPHTGTAPSEALVFGLSGGIGFMSFAFEYTGHRPMLTIGLRSDSYPDAFVRRGLERLTAASGGAADVRWHTTGSRRLAGTALDEALERGRAALVAVDLAGLPWYGTDGRMAGYGPLYVGVVGRDGDRVAIDDRAPQPLVLPADGLADARAAYAKGKHALATLEPVAAPLDVPALASAVLDAARGTARGFHEAPVKGYGANFGLRGLETWAARIVDRKDRKGWPTLLAEPPAFAAAMARMVEGIDLEFTPPTGGRPLYAEFLDEAAILTGRAAFRDAAAATRAAGEAWRAFARAALPDDEPVLVALRATLEGRLEAIDELGADAAGPNAAARAERERLIAGARLERPLDAVLEGLGELARDVVAAERAAVAALEDASA